MIAAAVYRACQHCQGMIGPLQRSDALFCSLRCRVAALRKRRKVARQGEILAAASERWDKEIEAARAIAPKPKKVKPKPKKKAGKPAKKRNR